MKFKTESWPVIHFNAICELTLHYYEILFRVKLLNCNTSATLINREKYLKVFFIFILDFLNIEVEWHWLLLVSMNARELIKVKAIWRIFFRCIKLSIVRNESCWILFCEIEFLHYLSSFLGEKSITLFIYFIYDSSYLCNYLFILANYFYS